MKRFMAVVFVCVLFFSGVTHAGLVAYYPFNGNANDESGNGNNGTVHGANLTEDRFGNANSAYIFDGDDDYIEVADDIGLDITGSITIDAWINIDSLIGQSPGIIGKWYAPTNQRSFLLSVNNNFHAAPSRSIGFFVTPDGISQTFITSTEPLDIDTWHHIAGVYDGSSLSLYIDGELKSSASYSTGIFSGNAPVTIGDFEDSGNEDRFFDGIIDDVHIYDIALSSSDIQAVYNAPNPVPEPTTILLLGSGLIGFAGFRKTKEVING